MLGKAETSMFVATPVIPAASRNVARVVPLPLWSATKSRKVRPVASYLWKKMENKKRKKYKIHQHRNI